MRSNSACDYFKLTLYFISIIAEHNRFQRVRNKQTKYFQLLRITKNIEYNKEFV